LSRSAGLGEKSAAAGIQEIMPRDHLPETGWLANFATTDELLTAESEEC
jgi:hypothetical protein